MSGVNNINHRVSSRQRFLTHFAEALLFQTIFLCNASHSETAGGFTELHKIFFAAEKQALPIIKKEPVAAKEFVWRCGSSKIYHTSDKHRALTEQCTREIKELTLKEAQALNLRKCKCKY